MKARTNNAKSVSEYQDVEFYSNALYSNIHIINLCLLCMIFEKKTLLH